MKQVHSESSVHTACFTTSFNNDDHAIWSMHENKPYLCYGCNQRLGGGGFHMIYSLCRVVITDFDIMFIADTCCNHGNKSDVDLIQVYVLEDYHDCFRYVSVFHLTPIFTILQLCCV